MATGLRRLPVSTGYRHPTVPWMCAQGRGWARIAATVLLTLQTYTLYRDPFIRLGVSWTDVVPRVSFLIGLTAVILLWQRSAAPYFKAAGRRG